MNTLKYFQKLCQCYKTEMLSLEMKNCHFSGHIIPYPANGLTNYLPLKIIKITL